MRAISVLLLLGCLGLAAAAAPIQDQKLFVSQSLVSLRPCAAARNLFR